jgi:enoyl-CoA hydratase/carnithine racemase
MSQDRFRVELSDGVATVTLTNPAKRNALGLELMAALSEQVALIGADHDARVIVIAAEGPAFSAGHDLSEMVGREQEFYDALFDVCCELMTGLRNVRQPVIAKVDGIATAAGCQLVASCDLVVASDRSTFATPGVRIGLFCSTPMVPLSRAVGQKRALEMLLTGAPIDAATAADWGLVNRVVSPDELDAAVAELAAAVGRFSAETVSLGKQAFYAQYDVGEPAAYDMTRAVMAHNAGMVDAQEGIDAFLTKREPVWADRRPPNV